MNGLNEFLSESLMHAIGMTFLHSIWEGIVIGILVAVLFLCKPFQSATAKYHVSVFAIGTLFLVVCFTFANLYSQALSGIRVHGTAGITYTTFSSEMSLSDQFWRVGAFWEFLTRYSNWIATVWLMGVLVLTARLLGGFAYVHQLRTKGLTQAHHSWQFPLRDWSEKLNLKRIPALFESSLVSSPVTFGHLKPVILVPLGMLAHMPAEQLEAIIIHELMHIRNADYLTNLFLSLVGILLFFNPVVWWLSRIARREMEHRCDDMALSLTGKPKAYASALISLEEVHNNKTPALTMSMAAKTSHLTTRINRLFNQPKHKTMTYTKSIVTMTVLLVAALLFAFTLPASLEKSEKEISEQISVHKNASLWVPEADTIPLHIVDGKEVTKEEFDKLESDNIQSMFILKDKAAFEKYGERGKYGVVLVKTKDKTKDKDKIKTPKDSFKIRSKDGLEPLIFIDGIKSEDYSHVDTDSIVSVSVIKDEQALKQYGEEGINGVILILTKEGEREEK